MTIGKTYLVIGIETDNFRIIDDSDIPFLYDNNQFEIIDPEEPKFWVVQCGEDQEKYADPESWNHPGFFEDFHDGISSVVKQLWADYRDLYSDKTSV